MQKVFSILSLLLLAYWVNSDQLNLLMFTDMHFGENALKDLQTMAMQTFLIKQTNPDFVVLNGDQTSNYAYGKHGSQANFSSSLHEKYTLPLVVKQQDYSLILGNHDSGADITREEVLKLEIGSTPYSHTKGSDYYLLFSTNGIIKDDDTETVPRFILWFFDSHDRGCVDSIESWGCVNKAQIEWFQQAQIDLKAKYGDDLTSQVTQASFIHIPIDEFITVYNTQKVFGQRGEEISCPSVNTGIFLALKEAGVQAVFSGHDHNDDYGGELDGVKLVYGRKTGYGGYGPEFEDKPIKRGARIITLKYNDGVREIHSQIIEQDGNVVDNERNGSFRKDKAGQCAT